MNKISAFRPALLAVLLSLTACAGGAHRNPWDAQASSASASPKAINTSVAAAKPVAAQAPQAATAKVGILLPLSGQNEALGQAMLQAAQLALFDTGYASFELVPQDTRGTPEGAQAAAEAALKDGAQLLLGPVFAPEVRAVKPIAARRNVNLIAFTTDWTVAGGNGFVMGFLPYAQVQRVAQYASAHGLKRPAVIAPSTDYGNAVTTAFNAIAPRTGMAAPVVVSLPADMASLPASLAQLAPNGAPAVDSVLIPVAGANAAKVASALTASGMPADKVRRLGTGLWDDGGVAFTPDLSGGWFAAPQPDARKNYENKYRSTYGQTPPRLSSLAYDATALAAVLARNGFAASGKPAFDRTSLTNPNGFAGVDGVFRFQTNGMVDRGLSILELAPSGARVVDPAPKTFQRTQSF